MYASKAVHLVAGVCAGNQCEVVDDVPFRPVAGLNGRRPQRARNAKGMDAAKTVQDVSARAVAEERDPSRDVPARPVTADRGGWRHRLAVDSQWIQSAIAVEHGAAFP